MTIDQVKKKIAQLDQQREQLIANVNATVGALAAYREMLAELEKPDAAEARPTIPPSTAGN